MNYSIGISCIFVRYFALHLHITGVPDAVLSYSLILPCWSTTKQPHTSVSVNCMYKL